MRTRIRQFVNAVRKKRRRAYLAKYGCQTEEQYARLTDLRVNRLATRIVDFYCGYQYIVVFDDPLGEPWNRDNDWQVTLNQILVWCKEHVSNHWRHDWHRVYLGYDKQWHVNEIGGYDYIFFAFTDEADAVWFKLKWGGSS